MKSIFVSTIFCSVMGTCTFANAQASLFIELGTLGEERVAVTGPQFAMRVGNGVLLRSFSWKTGATFANSARLLASCRGQWLSDQFDHDMHEARIGWKPPAWQKEAREREVEVLSIPIELKSWAASDLDLAIPLRPKIEAVCKSASAEPRNVFLPVSSSVPDKSGVSRVSAIVTGTVARKEGLVAVWLRTSEFLWETIKVNNVAFVVDGVEQKRRVANGNYDMRRVSFDCKARQIGTHQMVSYKSEGTNTSDILQGRLFSMSDVTPNSVGEAELDAVCMLYGPGSP
jgi:hypothetical protein